MQIQTNSEDLERELFNAIAFGADLQVKFQVGKFNVMEMEKIKREYALRKVEELKQSNQQLGLFDK